MMVALCNFYCGAQYVVGVIPERQNETFLSYNFNFKLFTNVLDHRHGPSVIKEKLTYTNDDL